MGLLHAWSYSRLSTYEQCPEKAKFKFIDKIREPSNEHLERGIKAHEDGERFVSIGGFEPLMPHSLKLMAGEFKGLRKEWWRASVGGRGVEGQWAFTEGWEPTSWFGKDAWCRTVVDLFYIRAHTVHIVDYKTGKINPAHKEQLGLYAIGAFLKFPEVNTVRAKLWYLDHGEEVEVIFKRPRLSKLITKWENKVADYLVETEFPPKKNRYCYWCFFRAPGGPCTLKK